MDKQSLAFIRHELKNPLAAMQLYLEMLQKGMAGTLTPEQKNMIDEIVQSHQKMVKILEETKDESVS